MLEMHTSVIPPTYRDLLPYLLTPASWQQKGSIPGLVKLLTAFLARDAQQMVATGQYTAVLAVIQQRLIPSKQNDAWGFELLQAVVQYIPPAQLKQYMRALMVTLLTRMQTSKTDKYVYHFTHFFLFAMAIDVPDLGPDFVVSAVEEVQPGCVVLTKLCFAEYADVISLYAGCGHSFCRTSSSRRCLRCPQKTARSPPSVSRAC